MADPENQGSPQPPTEPSSPAIGWWQRLRRRWTRKRIIFAGFAAALSMLTAAIVGLPIAELVTRRVVRTEYLQKIDAFHATDFKRQPQAGSLGYRADPNHPIEYRMHPSHGQSRPNVPGHWHTVTNGQTYLADAWNLIATNSGAPLASLRWAYLRKSQAWVPLLATDASQLTNLTTVTLPELDPKWQRLRTSAKRIAGFTRNDRRWIFVNGQPGALVSNHARFFVPLAQAPPLANWMWRYTISDDGFRVRSQPRQANARRVMCLGDSAIFGWGIQDHETLIEQLERQLAREDSTPVQCFNLGIPGYNTEQQYFVLLENMDRIDPDAVVLWHVRNDLEPQMAVPARPERVFRHVLLNSWFLERSKKAWNYSTRRAYSISANFAANFGIQLNLPVDRLRLRPNLYLGTLDSTPGWQQPGRKQEAARAALTAIRDECRKRNCPLLIVTIPNLEGKAFIPEFYRSANVVKGWAAELEIPFLNLMPWVADRDHASLRVSEYDRHANVTGNAIFARAMVAPIRGLLEEGWEFRPSPNPE